MPIQRNLTNPAGLPATLPQGVEHHVQEADGTIVTYMGPIGGGAPVKVSGVGGELFCVEYQLDWGDIGQVTASVFRDDIGLVATPLTAARSGIGIYSITADINIVGPNATVADPISVYVIDFVESGPIHVKVTGETAQGWPSITVFDMNGLALDPTSAKVQIWYAAN